MKAIGVQFRSGIRVYDFKQTSEDMKLGGLVVVETVQGEEIGKIKYINKEVKKTEKPLKEVLRILTEKDTDRLHRLKLENSSFSNIFKERVKVYGLEMKLVDFEISLDGDNITFYFTAEKRVDFRELVRDLSRKTKMAVTLRQMGQRDEARALEGFGPCGREVCCRRFLKDMENISMDMVREQYQGGRSASKVSGMCGKLMCCLAFEKASPKVKTQRKK